jgi:hypothetical protein
MAVGYRAPVAPGRLFAIVAAALLVASCTPPGPDSRPLHPRAGEPAFLTVTNHARAPIGLGSATGLWVTLDVGRSWRAARPVVSRATAIGYTTSRALVARGSRYEIRDLSLANQVVFARAWPFSGSVVSLASDPRHARLWALVREKGGFTLRYANDGGRHWWERPAAFLCEEPRALAAAAEEGRLGRVRLFAACADGLYASDDLGVSFRRLDSAPTDVRDVATALFDPDTVVIATPVVRISRDRGETFSAAAVSASRVAVDPRNTAVLFAVGLNGRLYASADGGRHF